MCRRRDCKLKLRVGISPNKAARSQQLPGPGGLIELIHQAATNHEAVWERGVTFVSAVGLPAKRLQPSDLFGLTNGRHWPFFLPTSPLLLLLPTLRCLPIYAFQTKCRPFITSFVFFSPCLPYKYPTPPPPPPAFISFMSPLLRLSLPHALP
ncbi:unnamed protein product, partial [Musa textilis]